MNENTKILLKGDEDKTQLINLLNDVDISCSTRDLKSDLKDKIDTYNNCIDENIEFRTKFNVNERFDFLESLTEMVLNGEANSLIVVGEGGLGKTFTVLHTLNKKNKGGFLSLFKKSKVCVRV